MPRKVSATVSSIKRWEGSTPSKSPQVIAGAPVTVSNAKPRCRCPTRSTGKPWCRSSNPWMGRLISPPSPRSERVAGRGRSPNRFAPDSCNKKDALGRLSYVISEMFLSRFEALMLSQTKAYPLIDSVWAVGCPYFGCCTCKKSINQLSM